MDKGTISRLVSPAVAACGLEIDRVEILAAGRRKVVRIFLDGDGPEGRGPSLDEIAAATRAISVALDDAPSMGQAPYTLEVSSRGVSRPLTAMSHYRRNTGRLVEITGRDGARVTGRIQAVTETEVTCEVDGVARVFRLADITRAVVQVELSREAGEPDADEGSDDLDEDISDEDEEE